MRAETGGSHFWMSFNTEPHSHRQSGESHTINYTGYSERERVMERVRRGALEALGPGSPGVLISGH